MKYLIIACIFLVSCSKAKDKYPELDVTEYARMDYRALSQNLIENHTYGGFGVVSRGPNFEPMHSGEALIWGGTALWALPCDMGQNLSLEMARMVDKRGGAIIRVDPLGEYNNGREVTFDGFVGLLMGISRRIVACGELELWMGPFEKMVAYQKSNGNRMHPNVSQKIFGEFVYARELIASYLIIRSEPSENSKIDMEKLVGGWPALVQIAHATGEGSDACFRVNLALSTFLTVETMDKNISKQGRNQFCENTKGMGIPTVDHYCGRENIKSYIERYVTNQYEYRHQRCQWESPDGKNNVSPRLDLIVAYVMAYGYNSLNK